MLLDHIYELNRLINGQWQGSNVAKLDNSCNETGRLQHIIGNDDE